MLMSMRLSLAVILISSCTVHPAARTAFSTNDYFGRYAHDYEAEHARLAEAPFDHVAWLNNYDAIPEVELWAHILNDVREPSLMSTPMTGGALANTYRIAIRVITGELPPDQPVYRVVVVAASDEGTAELRASDATYGFGPGPSNVSQRSRHLDRSEWLRVLRCWTDTPILTSARNYFGDQFAERLDHSTDRMLVETRVGDRYHALALFFHGTPWPEPRIRECAVLMLELAGLRVQRWTR
jgi:hypothetical protein